MNKRQALTIGKTKAIWASQENHAIVKFMDNVDTIGYEFTEKVSDNGSSRMSIAISLFEELEKDGISTHFIERISTNEMIVKRLDMFPVEVVVRNIAEGSIVKNYLFNSGEYLKCPVVNLYLKYGYLDPILDENIFLALEIGSKKDWDQIQALALRVNNRLTSYFSHKNIELIDFKFECGKDENGNFVVGDEISPDCFRLREKESKKRIDKDLFRHCGESLENVLNELQARLGIR